LEHNREWCVNTILAIITVLAIFACVTVIIDPFCHYHKPLEGIIVSNEQSYINPGFVNQFEYDSLITGSSMVENFKTSYFKQVLGVNAIKVPFSGGTAKNMNIILQKALRKKPNLKNIYLGLDLYMLKKDTEKTVNPLPDYLYDSNPLSDVWYLLNKDILLKIDTFFKDGYNIFSSIRGGISNFNEFSFDDYSSWYNSFNFSQYATMKPYLNEKKADIPLLQTDDILKLPRDNLRVNIIPLIESHPNTDFTIFFPPYSIIFWYFECVENELAILDYTIKT
jgi:hypothetical protein